jgi:iron complex outermembrane receptor protein
MTVRKCDAVQETRVTVSRWLRTLVRILSAVLAITGLAAAQADAQDTVLSFDIPSQSLPAALDAFAEQAHVQMLYKADSVSDLQSTPVSGQLSAEQALHHLLQGTGLSFQSGGPNTITVVTPPAEPNHESAPPARDRPRTEKPVKVPEILVKDVQEREGETSYVAEDTKTATKIDIPLIETPQSISVITRARMQAQEVNSIGEALRYTPGVRGEPFGFDSRLTWLQFRGFDNTTNGLFKDGLQLRNPAFGISYNLEPYGAEQLDVLRGPASFLYGQGSPGGLLNYVSKRPTLQSLHEVQFLAGSFGRYEGRFDFGGRINDSDTFSFRMTGLIRESGTQIDNVPNDRVYIAPALTWRMASTTSLTFFATYQKDRAGAFQWLPADGTLGFNPNGFVQPHRFTGQPSVDRYNRTEHSVGYEFHHQLSENWKFLQKMRYNSNETDNVSTYVLGLEPDRRTAIRDQWSSYGKLTAIALDNQISGRLSTGPMQHTLLAGLDFQRISVRHNQNFAEASSVDIFNRYDYGTLGVVPYFDSKQDTKQLQTGVYIHGGGRVVRQHGAGHEGLSDGLQHDAAAQFFGHHHGVYGALAHAVVGFGHGQSGQAQLGQLVPGGAVKATGGHGSAAALKRVALVHPLAHGVAQLFLVVRKIEIHVSLLVPVVAPWRLLHTTSEALAGTPSRRGHGGAVLSCKARTVFGVSRAQSEPRCFFALRCCHRRWWSCAG